MTPYRSITDAQTQVRNREKADLLAPWPPLAADHRPEAGTRIRALRMLEVPGEGELFFLMEPHQKAWLSIHPEVSESWLIEKLSEGFDIHHIDGDNSNNGPKNLALVFGPDHARLHGMPFKQRKAREYAVGKMAYELRLDGSSWDDAASLTKKSHSHTVAAAKSYAKAMGLTWPLPRPEGLKSKTRRRRREMASGEYFFLKP